jgi:hypothetical protein
MTVIVKAGRQPIPHHKSMLQFRDVAIYYEFYEIYDEYYVYEGEK